MNAGTNETDAQTSARDCIAELRDLIAIVEDEEGSESTTAARREELGIDPAPRATSCTRRRRTG